MSDIMITFDKYVTVEAAEDIISSLALEVSSPLKQCGRGPLSVGVSVDSGTERDYVDKLLKTPGVAHAEAILFDDEFDNITDALENRLKLK